MIALLAAYVVWRVARRLIALVLLAALVMVLLAGRTQRAGGQIRRDVGGYLHQVECTIMGALRMGTGR